MLTTSVKIGNRYNYTSKKIEKALEFLRTTDFSDKRTLTFGKDRGKISPFS